MDTQSERQCLQTTNGVKPEEGRKRRNGINLLQTKLVHDLRIAWDGESPPNVQSRLPVASSRHVLSDWSVPFCFSDEVHVPSRIVCNLPLSLDSCPSPSLSSLIYFYWYGWLADTFLPCLVAFLSIASALAFALTLTRTAIER